jgi:fumarate reductase subunit C
MQTTTATTKTKEYVRPMPADWWMRNGYLVAFMIRELTCVFVGGYAFFLLYAVAQARSPESFQAFYNSCLACGWCIALQLVALGFCVFHSITWFNLTPKVLVIWNGEEKVSPTLIAGANHAAWAVASIVVLYLALSAK